MADQTRLETGVSDIQAPTNVSRWQPRLGPKLPDKLGTQTGQIWDFLDFLELCESATWRLMKRFSPPVGGATMSTSTAGIVWPCER